MDYGSSDSYINDSESDISESDISEYSERLHKRLRSGRYKVEAAGLNGNVLRCPFCLGKKKQNYGYKDLLQHALGVGKCSSRKSAKQKANHLALANYLKTDLASKVTQVPKLLQSVPQRPKQDDLYVWPWMGIVVNVVCHRELTRFISRFKVEVVDFSEVAILKFSHDWKGFANCITFEQSFKSDHRDAQKKHLGRISNCNGWCARATDYEAEGRIGDFLRSNGQLRAISDIEKELAENTNTVIANLTNQIEMTNYNLYALQSRLNEKTMFLTEIRKEYKMLNNAFQQEKMKYDLETKKKRLDSWSKGLDKLEAKNKLERQKLDEEKKKLAVRNNLW